MPIFGFVQMDFGALLGLSEGRYIVRPADGEAGADESVLVVQVAGAPVAKLFARRRPRSAPEAPAELPLTRITAVRPGPFTDEAAASHWLKAAGESEDTWTPAVEEALRVLNRALRAYASATADSRAGDVGIDHAAAIRLGFGSGEQLADGGYEEAIVLPRETQRRGRVERLRPQERVAAVLAGHAKVEPWETLILRARLDLDQGRSREAALQLRVGLEALLAAEEASEELRGARQGVGDAANEAIKGELSEASLGAVRETLARCERALKRRALS
jgi:hypothetical protein